VRAIRQRGERLLTDARILDTGPFVEQVLATGDARQARPPGRAKCLQAAQTLIRRRCREARGALAVKFVTRVGLSLADAARQLGISTSGIATAVARAERLHVH
jgi:putative transposase